MPLEVVPMKIPKKITPCPITEAIVEIRFDSEAPPDAVFGIVYTALKDTYPKNEKLPILQLPEILRNKDPNLIFKPYHKLTNENFIIQVGPKVLSISNINTYVGWDEFFGKIQDCLSKVQSLDIVSKVFRIGIRYINFFDFDIYDRVDLQLLLKGTQFKTSQLVLRAEIPSGDFLSILQIVNNAEVQIGGVSKKGSLIDIDVILQKDFEGFSKDMEGIVQNGHIEEKKLFFTLLKDEYIETLNPEY